MEHVNLTHHAELRFQQRGLQRNDQTLMLHYASNIGDSLFMSNKDASNAVKSLKNLIEVVERLRGVKMAFGAGGVITAYHCNKSKQKRLMRRRKGFS